MLSTLRLSSKQEGLGVYYLLLPLLVPAACTTKRLSLDFHLLPSKQEGLGVYYHCARTRELNERFGDVQHRIQASMCWESDLNAGG